MAQIVSPSLLSANFGNLQEDLKMINSSSCEWLHIDIMDGVFVPNLSFGPPVLKYVAELCEKPLDVHLMVVEPMNYLPAVKDLNARIMNIHYEASVLHFLLELEQFMSTELVMISNHSIVCCHLLLLPSIFPSIMIFTSE